MQSENPTPDKSELLAINETMLSVVGTAAILEELARAIVEPESSAFASPGGARETALDLGWIELETREGGVCWRVTRDAMAGFALAVSRGRIGTLATAMQSALQHVADHDMWAELEAVEVAQ